MKWSVLILALYFGHNLYQKKKTRNDPVARLMRAPLSVSNKIEIYAPENCGGCPICKKQVADIQGLNVQSKMNYLDSPDAWTSFHQVTKTETGDMSLGGPSNPTRMPAVKVNGKWLFGPSLGDLGPYLIKKEND